MWVELIKQLLRALAAPGETPQGGEVGAVGQANVIVSMLENMRKYERIRENAKCAWPEQVASQRETKCEEGERDRVRGRDWLAGEQQPLGRRVETSFAQSQQKATILSH